MAESLALLKIAPDYLLIDALRLDLPIKQKALIKGDARSVSIAAASILAKVARDLQMADWDKEFPQCGLAHNKGNHTREHLDVLRRNGPTLLHRVSFAAGR